MSRHTIYKWQKRRLPVQFFSVIRHEERADGWNAFVHGQRWTQSEDFTRWPFDPPLSDAGIEGARKIGQKMRSCAEACGSPLHVVVSSPYFRCVQTAVEICREIGPDVRLLIDHSLGEVYGPAVMGEIEPAGATRPVNQALAYCSSKGVACESRTIGAWPVWPEDLKYARWRFASRFLVYLHRSVVAQRNFILVTHADGVGAALRMMPSHSGSVLERVEYGGHFIAKRQIRSRTSSPWRSRSSCTRNRSATPAPCTPEETANGQEFNSVPCKSLEPLDLAPEQAEQVGGGPALWIASPRSRETGEALLEHGTVAPEAAVGWQVQTELVVTQRSGSGARTFHKSVQSLVKHSHSQLSAERVEELLVGLSENEKPLGDSPLPFGHLRTLQASASYGSITDSGQAPVLEHRLSLSTFLFGASDVGNENDIISPGDCGVVHAWSTDDGLSLPAEASRRTLSSCDGSSHGGEGSPSRRQSSPPFLISGSIMRNLGRRPCMELVREECPKEGGTTPATRPRTPANSNNSGGLPGGASWLPGGGTVGKGQAWLRRVGSAAMPRKRGCSLNKAVAVPVQTEGHSRRAAPGGSPPPEACSDAAGPDGPCAAGPTEPNSAFAEPLSEAERRRFGVAVPLGNLTGSALMRRRASQGLVTVSI